MLVPAIRAAQAEETGGEVTTAEEGTDNGEGIGAQRTHGGTVDFLITGDEGLPGGSDDLTSSMPSGFA